jgi:hypothetical protein
MAPLKAKAGIKTKASKLPFLVLIYIKQTTSSFEEVVCSPILFKNLPSGYSTVGKFETILISFVD